MAIPPMGERIVFINGGIDENNVFSEQFSYDFAPLAQEAREMRDRIRTATSTSFDYIYAFFSALASASYGLICSIVPSFTYSVLGLREGVPATIEALFFKTIVWAASLTLSFVLSVYNRFSQNLRWDLKENQETLMSLSKTLDSRHFKTKELTLDTSNVPANVTVNSLLGMFDQINFNDQNLPGYMAPASRQEGTTTYTIEQLKTYLATFASNVTNRTPFVGTPPAHDIMALMKFYQQIEDAVRLSIHKSNEDLSAFQVRSGTDVNTYEGLVLNEYKNILEDRSRLVIDLAIAGAHCGARFMGDSMSVYGNFYNGEAQTQKTLEDNLMEMLAHKRKQIVERMIQVKANANYNANPFRDQHRQGDVAPDTHSYAEHMALLGEILGLPGTNGIVEYLSNHLNRTETLKKFFTHYTEDSIIDSINEKWQDVKGGGAFRGQIYDWMTNLMGDWNKQKYADFLESDEIRTFQTQLESLKTTTEFNVYEEMGQLSLLHKLIVSLRPNLTEEKVSASNWNAFLETMLAKEDDTSHPMFGAKKTFRDEVNELASRRGPANTPAGQIKTQTIVESRRIITNLQATFSTEALGAELVSSLVSFTNGDILEIDRAPFVEIFSKPKKYNEVLRLFQSLGTNLASTTAAAVQEEASEAARALSEAHIEADSVSRFLDGNLPAKELLENTYEKTRKEEFIKKFQVYGDQGPVGHRYQNLTRQERIKKTENERPVFDEANQPVYEERTIYEPLPAALIEVLLVSHKIFLPQSITNGGI